MPMRSKAIIQIFILTTTLLHGRRVVAQNWEHHYDYNELYNIGYSIAKTDYGYITLSNTNDLIDIWDYDLMIMGIDEEGNQLFQKGYTLDSLDFANLNNHNMIASNDGNYLAAIFITFIGGPDQIESYATILKFNSDGDTLWTKTNSTELLGNYDAGSITQGNDGSIYLCGSHININDNILSRGFIMKTDAEGNYDWHIEVGTDYNTQLRDIKVYGDTLYAVGKYVEEHSIFDPARQQFIVKCSTNGTVYWTKYVDTILDNGLDWQAETCLLKANGNLLVGAGYTSSANDHSNQPMVMELDNETGDVLWKKGFGSSGSFNRIDQMKLLTDGNYVATGQMFVWESGAESDIAPFVLKFTPTGDSLWMRTIIPTWFESDGFPGAKATLPDFVINDDGGITAIGQLDHYSGDGPQSGWIQDTYMVRLDSMGCLVPGCDTLVNVAENSIEKLAVGLYPNPATDILNIHFENAQQHQSSTFEIYDLSGKMVKTWQTNLASATIQLNIEDMPYGSYLLRVLNETGQFLQEKFVVMK